MGRRTPSTPTRFKPRFRPLAQTPTTPGPVTGDTPSPDPSKPTSDTRGLACDPMGQGLVREGAADREWRQTENGEYARRSERWNRTSATEHLATTTVATVFVPVARTARSLAHPSRTPSQITAPVHSRRLANLVRNPWPRPSPPAPASAQTTGASLATAPSPTAAAAPPGPVHPKNPFFSCDVPFVTRPRSSSQWIGCPAFGPLLWSNLFIPRVYEFGISLARPRHAHTYAGPV